jgi:hypothetical protein
MGQFGTEAIESSRQTPVRWRTLDAVANSSSSSSSNSREEVSKQWQRSMTGPPMLHSYYTAILHSFDGDDIKHNTIYRLGMMIL